MNNDEKKEESTKVLEKLAYLEGKLDAMASNTSNNFIYMLGLTMFILSTSLYLNLNAIPTSSKNSLALFTFFAGSFLLALYFYRFIALLRENKMKSH